MDITSHVDAALQAAKTARQVTRNPDVRRVLDSAMFSQKDNKKVFSPLPSSSSSAFFSASFDKAEAVPPVFLILV